MNRQWTFSRKIAVGFGVTTLLSALSALFSILALRGAVDAKDTVIDSDAPTVLHATELAASLESAIADTRGFLLDARPEDLERLRGHRADIVRLITTLRGEVHSAEQRQSIDEYQRAMGEYVALTDRGIEMRKSQATGEALSKYFSESVHPKEDGLERIGLRIVANEQAEIADRIEEANGKAQSAVTLMIVAVVVILFAAVLIAVFLTRGLTRQIGSAIQHVQSSSAELQAAANEQAAGAREQTSATQEVTTTLKELSATSRQMSDSAQRVTKISEDTVTAGRAGDVSVQAAQEAILSIKRQVDLVVSHMLDLGKKSQQVGAVLEIINELAEQTNILSINATIESAGAGEAGKRFGVVADEIRKLADRVGGSTKEIRTLIDEIRSAANTTVMATEDGAKAVEAGTRQFGEVTHAFRKIVGMMQNTTDAAREIELGARQQVTAVDQVNIALQNVTQAVRDAEASTRDTLETSTQLATLSRNLILLVKPEAG